MREAIRLMREALRVHLRKALWKALREGNMGERLVIRVPHAPAYQKLIVDIVAVGASTTLVGISEMRDTIREE
jgi:hypothetical protein